MAHTTAHTPHQQSTSETYAWYVVGLLIIAYTFSFIDRQILSLLVEPMKRDMDLSDTQMSLLQGFAFAIFYSLFGLPIGRLVDTSGRVRIISLGIFFWSLMTALCGTARSYGLLFLYRMGVGVGEAALSPAAYSMLSDYFKPQRLGLAIGIYGAGVYIGAGLALVIGGIVIEWAETISAPVLPLVGEIYSWQLVFLMVGLPGIPLALWMATVREPKRRGVAATATHVPMPVLLKYMKANRRTLTCHHLSYALTATMAYGTAAWVPSFFIRTYGWTAGQVGLVYGLIIVVFGTAGVITGGWLGDKLNERFRNGKMRVHLICAFGALPFAIASPLMPNATLAVVFLIPATYLATFVTGAGPAGLQEIMPNKMRGFTSAFMIFVITLIGLGLGPTLIALGTDYVLGDENLIRYSLAVVPSILLLLAGAIAWLGLDAYSASRDYLDAWLEREGERGEAHAEA